MSKRSEANAQLAGKVAAWLGARGCKAVTVVQVEEIMYVHYTLQLDMKPQPAIKIDGSIIFPQGSQMDVLEVFFQDWTG
jgi:hypothetical protein